MLRVSGTSDELIKGEHCEDPAELSANNYKWRGDLLGVDFISGAEEKAVS